VEKPNNIKTAVVSVVICVLEWLISE